MTQFFQQFLEPDIEEDIKEETNLSLMKEVFALEVDDFVSAHDVLFRKYDFDKHYDKLAKTYDCEEKTPWKIEALTEGIAKKGVQFPHAEYMKMRRNTKHGNTFFASWNFQIGEYSVGTLTVPGSGYALRTYNMVEKDLRKLIQRIVNSYNESSDVFTYMQGINIKFEAIPKEDDFGNYGRTIGLALVRGVSRLHPEVMIVETPHRVVEDKRHG
jgi:hypothetical protein